MYQCLRRILRLGYHTVSLLLFALATVAVLFWARSYWLEEYYTTATGVLYESNNSPDGAVWIHQLSANSKSGILTLTFVRARHHPTSVYSIDQFHRSASYHTRINTENDSDWGVNDVVYPEFEYYVDRWGFKYWKNPYDPPFLLSEVYESGYSLKS